MVDKLSIKCLAGLAETNDVFDSRSKIEKEVEEAIHGLLFALCKLKKAIRLSHH